MRLACDLARFRYHTGSALRPVGEDEHCPILFRDLGLPGMALYLAGRLTRLAGPFSPLTYLRSARYMEPYTDHEDIGRLVVLAPRALAPWHAGVPEVYVAAADAGPVSGSVSGSLAGCLACVPRAWATPGGERRLAGLPDAAAVREVLGAREHDERLADLAGRISALQDSLAASEIRAAPLRAQLQSGRQAERERLRREMAAHGVSEADLCSAWHHVPREARSRLTAWLQARP